jgi:hypothetical protein
VTNVSDGAVRNLLRIEGLGVLLLTAHVYGLRGQGWWLWILLFLVPDLSLLGYLGGQRLGARLYNAVHTYVAPMVLAGVGALAFQPLLVSHGVLAEGLMPTRARRSETARRQPRRPPDRREGSSG